MIQTDLFENESGLRLCGVTTSAPAEIDPYDWINNKNFIKDAHKHTDCSWELSKNEIWLGNTSGNDRLEKGVEIPDHYRSLKTIRLGEQAYCIKGKPLSRDYCRPLIIDKSEEPEYERIYMKRMSSTG